MLSKKWTRIVEFLDYSYQPIVNTQTGKLYAVEALLRNVNRAGFQSIDSLFNNAYKNEIIAELDIELRKKAIEKFTKIEFYKDIKIFYNYDPRILEMKNYKSGLTEEILEQHNLGTDSICFELNEKNKVKCIDTLKIFLKTAKSRNIKIALDDFGAGFASFELFYHSEPDFIKFDRFLIQNINNDIRKKTFCSHIINLAKMLGVITLAEGIENESELSACIELNFDLLQGYIISHPLTDVKAIEFNYPIINTYNKRKNSIATEAENQILSQIEFIDPVTLDTDIDLILNRLRTNDKTAVIPIVDNMGCPIGLIDEKKLKNFLYTPYGRDLLKNRYTTEKLNTFIKKSPIIDIKTQVDKMLEIFVSYQDAEGLIITKDMRYTGFLDARSVLNIINEKNLEYAREINPLTKLPGNIMINKNINNLSESDNNTRILVYFDFDYFKPFNDKFGFRLGDRAIILFAELLQKIFTQKNDFIGHIGGDDFFVSIISENYENDIKRIKNSVTKFREDALSFFEQNERESGFYISKDRSGNEQAFKLLSVSASIIVAKKRFDPSKIIECLSDLKKKAKQSDDGINLGLFE